MSLRKYVALPLFALTWGSASAAAPFAVQDPPSQADNSKSNKDQSPTADDQKMNPADRDLTKKIRTSIHQDKSLSTYGHNIKIIAQSGRVTLKGPVRSDEEKAAIAAKAIAIAGDGNVDNQLEVVPPKQ